MPRCENAASFASRGTSNGIDSTFQQFWKMIPKGLPERVGFGGFGPSTTMVTMAENFKARP
jgi:ABC-type tungstate transport system permease subunit